MNSMTKSMRIIHRYLGFFLAGIFMIYALSGIVLIYRDSDFLKQERQVKKQIKTELQSSELGQVLGMRQLKVEKEEGNLIYFEGGVYNKTTGSADYKVKELPFILNKMTQIHKSQSKDPLFFLNVFFGVSLVFFIISAFWMFTPKTAIFKKGLYFTLGGFVLALILFFV
ncbi:MAG: hypothetical protein GZ094_18075 [Mariniphaga sp.]|nr:hypothetical protein [Mariniphaga sp.]